MSPNLSTKAARTAPGTERDLVGYGRTPPSVHWPNGAKLALSLVLNYEEGSEYNYLEDGRNDIGSGITYVNRPDVRDLANESSYEYGSRAGVWRLLRVFERHRVQVTVFTCAVAIERNPQVGAAIRETGHEPCGHGWRWEEAWTLSEEEEQERIGRAIESIAQTCGERPLGWYCRYGPSERTRELLVREGGFLYDSNSYADDLPYFVEVGSTRHLVIPYSHSYNDGRFAIPPVWPSPSDWLENCRRGIEFLREEGATHPKMISLGLHSRWIGQASRASALSELIGWVRDLGDVWIARRADIARWWWEQHQTFT
jgi:peptidoglycan/xylan/chitin deacetylase (PgdA/CDA1 family)